jgi:hypothetical protein
MSSVCCESCRFFEEYEEACVMENWYACCGPSEYEDDNGDIINECDICTNDCVKFENRYYKPTTKIKYGLINLE